MHTTEDLKLKTTHVVHGLLKRAIPISTIDNVLINSFVKLPQNIQEKEDKLLLNTLG